MGSGSVKTLLHEKKHQYHETDTIFKFHPSTESTCHSFTASWQKRKNNKKQNSTLLQIFTDFNLIKMKAAVALKGRENCPWQGLILKVAT